MNSWDIIIAGAGIIGVSLALELREQGARVLVLDRGESGSEASSAAAGMLAADDSATPAALRPLTQESARMFPEYVRKIEGLSGIKTDFRRQGTIVFGQHAVPPPAYKELSSHELRQREPFLQSHSQPAFFVQEDSVDPRLLMKAAVSAAQNGGVEIRGSTEVKSIRAGDNGVEVLTNAGVFAAAQAINCRGAWSGAPVRPRKGQMLYLQPERKNLLRHVVHAPEVYIVPRTTGKILVGATVEDVGFDKTVTPSTIQDLLKAATLYLPELASAPIIQSWAGLRPGTPDDLPILGLTDTPGVFVASGHFRNGILLAPVTAKIMAEIMTGKQPSFAISAFAPSRFAPANV
ncbi:MAG TPA: glycine oxidase ThiO [Candidatus Angelobacter sp.]|nr:glycine oxidase ThiO [Candidatus Angelobacter sp.]